MCGFAANALYAEECFCPRSIVSKITSTKSFRRAKQLKERLIEQYVRIIGTLLLPLGTADKRSGSYRNTLAQTTFGDVFLAIVSSTRRLSSMRYVCEFLLNLSRTFFDSWNSTPPQTTLNLTVYLVKRVPKVAFVSFASGHTYAAWNS